MGSKNRFKEILNQEIEIFEALFTKYVETSFFEGTVAMSQEFNNQYNFLKHFYKGDFFKKLKTNML